MSETILISYPHSGQNLFSGTVEAWTGRPTLSMEGQPSSTLHRCASADCDPGIRVDMDLDPSIRVGHGAHALAKFNDGRRLIWLRRDPVEAMMSYWAASDSLPHEVLLEAVTRTWPRTLRQDCNRMWKWIGELYDKWEGEKAIVDYKDLVTEPIKVIRGLSESGFLPERGKTCAELLRDPEKVTRAILAMKSKSYLGSQTGGSDFTYWRDRLSERALTRFRNNLPNS